MFSELVYSSAKVARQSPCLFQRHVAILFYDLAASRGR